MDNFDMNDSASSQAKIALLTKRVEVMEQCVKTLQDAVIGILKAVDRLRDSESA